MTATIHSGFTMADQSGKQRLRKLQERLLHIDNQVSELMDKRYIIQHEIHELQKELDVNYGS